MKRILITLALVGIASIVSSGQVAAQSPMLPYDHIHLNVPDPPTAVAWYEKHFGAKRHPEGPDRLVFGSTRFAFARKADAKPSVGSAVDHIGFSVPNIEATMKELEAGGAKVVTPMREVPGLFKLAFVEDPWGTRIEVVQDAELLGFHHIHLRAPDPDQMLSWFLAKFGGQKAQLKGRIDAIKYGGGGFSDVWVLVQKGEAEPSVGHAIDHVSWRSTKALADTMTTLKGQGVTVESDPRQVTLPNGPPITVAFVQGPGGVRIELVERPGLKPGQ